MIVCLLVSPSVGACVSVCRWVGERRERLSVCPCVRKCVRASVSESVCHLHENFYHFKSISCPKKYNFIDHLYELTAW